MAVDNSKIVYGGTMMLFINTGSTLNPLAFANSASLSVSMATRDAASKDSGNWPAKLPAKYDWNVSTDGLMAFDVGTGSTDVANLYTAMLTRLPLPVSFTEAVGTSPVWTAGSGTSFTGTVYITSIELSAGDNENSTYSVSTEGTGELSMS